MKRDKQDVKLVFKCPAEHKKLFSQAQCALTISVGQKAHEAEAFEATINLINKSFVSCVILVDDSLQRHTMAINTLESADFFYKISIEEGDHWLARNQHYLDTLSIPYAIVRWDTWLHHPDYARAKSNIELTIANDLTYKNVFNKTIDEFLQRYSQRLDDKRNFNEEKAWKHCFDYLVEECAILCLCYEIDCQFEIYPSERNFIMAETYKRFVLPKYPDLFHPVSIKFKSRKKSVQSSQLQKQPEETAS